MVTHNTAILQMADHIIQLHDGKIRKDIENDKKIFAKDLEW
jgi:putative ABC transport system ATP-binding protein